jgi:serine/threonine-protein kinase
LLAPIARALAYSHKQNVIHRDIKPSNILITENGQLMLTDFGIARVLQAEETLDLTGTGMGIGTPEYMAPEQGLGHKVDHRADIYALGIILYEMVTGRKPFQADTPMAVVIKQINDPLPRPTQFVPDLPKDVERILLKALAKDPGNRYQSMKEMAVALEKLAESTTGKARKKHTAAKIPRKKTKQVIAKSKVVGWVLFGILGIGLIYGVRSVDIGALAELFPTSTPTATFTPTSTHIPEASFTPKASSTPETTATPAFTATPTLGVGSSVIREKDGMTMGYIPAGDFEMGSKDGDIDENPIHTVYLDPYWIDETEVTNGMYAKCVTAGVCDMPAGNDYDDSSYTFHPVVFVNWKNAQAYCAWADSRLPTEAEWEKAARGGLKGKKYPWGDSPPVCQMGAENGAQHRDCGIVDPSKYDYEFTLKPIGGTASVGNFSANGYGLYDMSGNVWEWVSDWYDSDYYANSPGKIPSGPSFGDYRVLRGGSWLRSSNLLRSADRNRNNPTSTSNNAGFRCARESDTQ